MTRALLAMSLNAVLLTTLTVACRQSPPRAGSGGEQGGLAGASGASGASGAPGVRNTTNARGDTAVWQIIFDGTSLAGWHGFKTPGKAPAGWQALDGSLTRVAEGGDLVTDRTYANFELMLEWQISAKGNSGILYRIDPTADVTYESGPEMQVLDDDGHADGKSRLTSAGSVYGLYPSPEGVVKSPGMWNAARLVVNGAHVEHWLNGVKVAEYELWSPDWERRVKASKFGAWPGYGRAQRGYIGLQDHGDRVSYRNIRIRELP